MFAMWLALGCAIWPRVAFPHAQETTTVQFDREIVRILNNHCVMCHMEKGLAFPLETYEQTYAARWQIRQGALNRHMPPWAAVPGYGDFANDNSLTQREIDFLVAWAESYGPRNNGAVYTGVATQTLSKPVQARTNFARWALGEPDALLRVPASSVQPHQAMQIRRSIIDPKLKSERWLRALEYKPGDRRVVRAVSFTIQGSGEWIGSWTPWYPVVSLPDELAFRLRTGARIVAEIHYFGAKDPTVDEGSVALYYAARPSARVVSNLVLNAKPEDATSGSSRKLRATTKLTADTNILALQPAMQSGLRSVEVSARAPDGTTQVLLFAKAIPLDWPTPYVYRERVSLSKGTELFVVEHYDNDAPVPAAGSAVTLSLYQGTALVTARPKVLHTSVATRRFELSGTVKSVDAANGRLVVDHGDIPGLMGAMTMSYSVSPRDGLKDVAAGDEIRSDVVVSDTGSHLENVQVVRRGK
jgi:Cu/Ag efflux protein CusF